MFSLCEPRLGSAKPITGFAPECPVAPAAYTMPLTIKQAAGKLGVSASLLYQIVSRKEIAHYRVGSKILFDDADLDAFRRRCRVEPAEAMPQPNLIPEPPFTLKHVSVDRSGSPARRGRNG